MAKKKFTLECHDCESILNIVVDDNLNEELSENDIQFCPICGSKDNFSIES